MQPWFFSQLIVELVLVSHLFVRVSVVIVVFNQEQFVHVVHILSNFGWVEASPSIASTFRSIQKGFRMLFVGLCIDVFQVGKVKSWCGCCYSRVFSQGSVVWVDAAIWGGCAWPMDMQRMVLLILVLGYVFRSLLCSQ